MSFAFQCTVRVQTSHAETPSFSRAVFEPPRTAAFVPFDVTASTNVSNCLLVFYALATSMTCDSAH